MTDSKSTKLVINLKDGVIQAEGDEAFVREVYNDFKEVVSKRAVIPPAPAALEQSRDVHDGELERQPAGNPKAKAKGKRAATGGAKSGDSTNYKPKFDNDLDLNGLDDFCAKYSPNGNSEKILVFTAFLRDSLQKSPCTADEIYTCFFTAKEKIPTAFLQAFRNCQSRTHYIKYESPAQIEVAIPGNNWLNAQAKKKASAE